MRIKVVQCRCNKAIRRPDREMNDRVINSRLKPLHKDIDRTKQLTGVMIGLEYRSRLFVLVSFVTLEILLQINPYRLNLLIITELPLFSSKFS